LLSVNETFDLIDSIFWHPGGKLKVNHWCLLIYQWCGI